MTKEALPEQARKQLEEAERIEAELGMSTTPEDATPAPVEPELTPEPPLEPEPEPEPQPAPEPEPPLEPQPTPEPDDKWEERYRAIQGKYDAEVPRLSQQNDQLNSQVGDLSTKLSELTDKLETLTATPEEPQQSLISDKDEENFGSDLIDLMRRVVRDDIGALSVQLQSVIDDVSSLKNTLQTVGTQTQQTHAELFDRRLLELIPDWEAINKEPEWLTWLGEVDSLTGNQRQQQLNFAHSQLNADRVAEFFKAYKATKAPAPADPSVETPTPQPSPGDSLESQVAPGKSAASQAQQQLAPEEKIWTEAEVAQALSQQNLKRLKPDQVTALMNEIDAAAAQGRVKPN